jgi:hypothetical protein
MRDNFRRMKPKSSPIKFGVAVLLALPLLTACLTTEADSEFFGKVEPPEGQVMRYVSGSEPESLDPQVGTGQP